MCAASHGAFLSGLREASHMYRTTRVLQNNPRNFAQRNAGPNNAMLAELLKRPVLGFGSFSFVFDPFVKDPRSMGFLRITFDSNKENRQEELPDSFQDSLDLLLQLYTVISYKQACKLEQVVGGDESRLSYLVKNLGFKLMDSNAPGNMSSSLITGIASARRAGDRNRILAWLP